MAKKGMGLLLVFVLIFATAAYAQESGSNYSDISFETSGGNEVLESTKAKGTKTENDKIVVGICLASSSHQTFIDMIRHARTLEEPLNCEIIELYFEQDINKLVRGIEDFTSANADVIIFQNGDPEATREAVAAANAKGIITIAWDIDMDICDFAFIGINHEIGYAIGKQAADYINNELGGKAKVGLFKIESMSFFVERGVGMSDAIRELAPEVEIVSEVYGVSLADGYSDAENLMTLDPGINVLVALVDNPLIGAYQAFEAAGRGQSAEDRVAFFGCDCTTEGMRYMTDGNDNMWFGSIFMDLNNLTKEMVTAGVNARRGIMPEYRVGRFKTIPVNVLNYEEYPAIFE